MSSIRSSPEVSRPPLPGQALENAAYEPTEEDLVFLRVTIAKDDDEIKRRVKEVQKEAYAEYPYPCIRGFRFVHFIAHKNPVYNKVVEAGKADPSSILIDVGCCMGTELRKIESDGYPGTQLIGCDIRNAFIDLGHKLFQDAGKTPIHFIEADMFSVQLAKEAAAPVALNKVTKLDELAGQVKHIYASMLFHLFNQEAQRELALKFATLAKRKPGTILFGAHQGLETAALIDDRLGRDRWGHSTSSWEALWHSVFTELEGETFAKEKLTFQTKLIERPFGEVNWKFLVWSIEIS